MLRYTTVVFEKMIEEFKKAAYIFSLVVQGLYIAYLAYALLTDKGVFIVNILLGAISAIYLYYYVNAYNKKEFEIQSARNMSKRLYKWAKMIAKAFTVLPLLYGLYIAVDQASFLDYTYAIVTSFVWIFQILFELTALLLQKRMNLILDALKMDFEGLIKTVDMIRKMKGEDPFWAEPTNRDLLTQMAGDYKKEKKEKKKERKKLKKLKKIEKKQMKAIGKLEAKREKIEKSLSKAK